MAKVRIFKIAKELNLSHTDILNFLKARNIKVSSHMSQVDESTQKEIMKLKKQFSKESSMSKRHFTRYSQRKRSF